MANAPEVSGPQDNLNVSIAMGSLEAAQKAHKEGASINRGCEHTGWMPIHGAASGGHLDILEWLVEMKADVSTISKRYMQPIHLAAKEGDVRMLQRLLTLRADIEAKNIVKKRPIHYACEAAQVGVVQYLVEAGCDPLTPDRNNLSPYDYAVLAADQSLPGSESTCNILGRIDCAKTGGGVKKPLPGAIPFTGIVTQVGEDVNKPGSWWWDCEKRCATDEPRPAGHEHPNLPRQPQ